MNIDEVFTAFRRRGWRPRKAAALTTYALLMPYTARKDLGLSPRRIRRVRKAMAQAGIDPAVITLLTPSALLKTEDWQQEGVLHSGAV